MAPLRGLLLFLFALFFSLSLALSCRELRRRLVRPRRRPARRRWWSQAPPPTSWRRTRTVGGVRGSSRRGERAEELLRKAPVKEEEEGMSRWWARSSGRWRTSTAGTGLHVSYKSARGKSSFQEFLAESCPQPVFSRCLSFSFVAPASPLAVGPFQERRLFLCRSPPRRGVSGHLLCSALSCARRCPSLRCPALLREPQRALTQMLREDR